MAINLKIELWKSGPSMDEHQIDAESADAQVKSIRSIAAETLNLTSTSLDLVFGGIVLEDDQSLAHYGIDSGAKIYAFLKSTTDHQANPVEGGSTASRDFADNNIHKVVKTYRNIANSSRYRNVLQRVGRPKVMEKMLTSIRGLAEDTYAVSFLHDSELLLQLSDANVVRRLAKDHPTIVEGATFLAGYIQNECKSSGAPTSSSSTPGEGGSGTASTSAAAAGYSLEQMAAATVDALSDDDDSDLMMQSEMSSPGEQPPRNGRVSSAQLAAAIQNAAALANNMSDASSSTTSSPTASRSLITNEMFTNAIQRVVSTTRVNDTVNSPSQQYRQQLQQMHEMGLTNDIINIQALQVTDGDVQAAVELVLSGE